MSTPHVTDEEVQDVLDSMSRKDWDACVWLDANYVAGNVDPADRKRLVRHILELGGAA